MLSKGPKKKPKGLKHLKVGLWSGIRHNKLIKDLKANDKRNKKHNRKGGHRRTLRKSKGAGERARGRGEQDTRYFANLGC